MKKNEKLLRSLLMFNMAVSGIAAADMNTLKYERMYEKMTKNIRTNKSNKENYQLIERILNQKNKELKDLYLQGEYIIKPEYLEWQLFFNTFGSKTKIGGEKNSIVTYAKDEIKSVKFGMMLPIKEISEKEVNVNISEVKEPEILVPAWKPNKLDMIEPYGNFTPFSEISTPNLVLPFLMYSPHVTAGKFGFNTNLVQVADGTGNTASLFTNVNVSATNAQIKYESVNTHLDINGTINYSGGLNGVFPTPLQQSVSTSFSAIQIGNNGDYNISGNWDFHMNKFIYNSSQSFLSYNPYYLNLDSKVVFDGNLDLKSSGSNSTWVAGMALNTIQPNTNINSAKVIFENKGNITISSSENSNASPNVAGMMLDVYDTLGGRRVKAEMINSGTINLESLGSLYGGTNVGLLINVGNDTTGEVLVKPGIINVGGGNGIGISFGTYLMYVNSSMPDSNVVIDGTGGEINITGSRSTGLYMYRANKPASSNNGIENIKNLTINLDGEYSTAFIRRTYNMYNINDPESSIDMILDNNVFNEIKLGNNFKSGAIFRIIDQGVITLGQSLEQSIGVIEKGTHSAVGILETTTAPASIVTKDIMKIKNYMPITITSNTQGMMGFVIRNAGTIENYADIVNNSQLYTDHGNNE